MECKYKPVDRTGLYFMVVLILVNVALFNEHKKVRDTNRKCTEILEKLDRIELKVDSLTFVQDDSICVEK